MFWTRFIEICNEKGKKPNPVAKELGIPSGSVTDWKNGRMPRDTTLRKIADYFGVSVEYLKGEESISQNKSPDTPKTVNPQEKEQFTEQEKTLLQAFRETTEEGRMRIIQSVLNICDEIKLSALRGNVSSSAG